MSGTSTTRKVTKAERDEAVAKLRELAPPGTRVHAILRHVAQSGQSRVIDFVVIRRNEPQSITWLVRRVLGGRLHPSYEGLVVRGYGADMAHDRVHALAEALYGAGYEPTTADRARLARMACGDANERARLLARAPLALEGGRR